MKRELSDWRSFWDIATPQQGATALIEIYGPAAAKAVMTCAAAALDDNRDDDYQFWTAVLGCVQAAERAGGSRAIRN